MARHGVLLAAPLFASEPIRGASVLRRPQRACRLQRRRDHRVDGVNELASAPSNFTASMRAITAAPNWEFFAQAGMVGGRRSAAGAADLNYPSTSVPARRSRHRRAKAQRRR